MAFIPCSALPCTTPETNGRRPSSRRLTGLAYRSRIAVSLLDAENAMCKIAAKQGQIMRLTKAMYKQPDCKLFGLSQGQVCGDDLAHNGGWYNGKGEKLGWGDLSVGNFVRIMKELEPGETFVVIGESDSYWDVRHTSKDEYAPGIEYVAEKARYIIQNGVCYIVPQYDSNPTSTEQEGSLTMHKISRGQAKSLLKVGS